MMGMKECPISTAKPCGLEKNSFKLSRYSGLYWGSTPRELNVGEGQDTIDDHITWQQPVAGQADRKVGRLLHVACFLKAASIEEFSQRELFLTALEVSRLVNNLS